MRIGSFFTFLYWTLVIGSLVGAYYYLRPFIDVGRQNVNSIQATIEQIRGAAGSLPSNLDIGSILEQFKKGQ
ncbi:MAG: hypothetical protein HYS59_02575 [Candidatus Vogelbacteria bacterium]|nr:hypothetical protein [Candidatus Vogelbacteria bacterium]